MKNECEDHIQEEEIRLGIGTELSNYVGVSSLKGVV